MENLPGSESAKVAVSSNPTFREVLQRQEARAREKTPQRETSSIEYEQSRARTMFVSAVNSAAPNVVRDLYTIYLSYLEYYGGVELSTEAELERIAEVKQFVGGESEDAAVAEWSIKHKLDPTWIIFGAIQTLGSMILIQRDSLPLLLGFPDRDANPEEGKIRRERIRRIASLDGIEDSDLTGETVLIAHGIGIPDILYIEVPVYIQDLVFPGEDDDTPGDVVRFGTFNPRAEKVETATRRLLKALEPRLRATLERIVAEDLMLDNATKPEEFRSDRAFEWLVRYRVLGESLTQIVLAEARKKDPRATRGETSNVSRAVKRAAVAIGCPHWVGVASEDDPDYYHVVPDRPVT